jgi:hypothetical protein
LSACLLLARIRFQLHCLPAVKQSSSIFHTRYAIISGEAASLLSDHLFNRLPLNAEVRLKQRKGERNLIAGTRTLILSAFAIFLLFAVFVFPSSFPLFLFSQGVKAVIASANVGHRTRILYDLVDASSLAAPCLDIKSGLEGSRLPFFLLGRGSYDASRQIAHSMSATHLDICRAILF